VVFGEPIDAAAAEPGMMRERMLRLSEFAFQKRPKLAGHLGREAVKNLWRNQFKSLVIDGTDEQELSGGKVLAASIVLAKFLKENGKGKRVGIILPSGRAGLIANLGTVLAGKIPVNLNFTAGRGALESAMKRAEIETMISALPVKKKAKDVPWAEGDDMIWLDKTLPGLKKNIVLWRIGLLFIPGGGLLANMLDVPKRGDQEEGTILFTSGSSGEPKGVILTHRNIIGNVEQITEFLDLGSQERILASLPIFHSFGFTVTMWWPLLHAQPIVSYPSPLEVGKNAELIEKYRITLMVATPTFFRGYLKRVEPKQLEPLRLVVSGAEKLPADLAEKFEERFGKRILEGYGLTETTPVVSVNMPNPPTATNATDEQERYRFGSVGRLLPGIALQIRDAETDEKLSIHDVGMCYFKGPNIFQGYLKDEERSAEVLNDGWFRTGDLARMDEDGFLHIEGRLSRFSKIGGEMVPHLTVESKIEKALGLEGEETQTVAIMGVPDQAKGEALVLLTTRDVDLNDLRATLRDMGVPNLWIPKRVKQIDEIPTLASGKLDLKSCQKIALSEGEGAEAAKETPAPASEKKEEPESAEEEKRE
jgi:acyl-[acyl-carrier-protein]-phospholipid O-acyltransferase/long-chain-fatty-acid--[acyl-carrier-protein] ligase